MARTMESQSASRRVRAGAVAECATGFSRPTGIRLRGDVIAHRLGRTVRLGVDAVPTDKPLVHV